MQNVIVLLNISEQGDIPLKQLFLLAILSIIISFSNCASNNKSVQNKTLQDFIVVEAIGDSKQEAVNRAYRKIVYRGLQVWVSDVNKTIDVKTRLGIINKAPEGFVHSFSVISVNSKPPESESWEITARGKISETKIEKVMEESSKQSRPLLILFFSEEIEKTKNSAGKNRTELIFKSVFHEFPFVNQEKFQNATNKELEDFEDVYSNNKALNRALQIANQLQATILVTGKVDVMQLKPSLKSSSLKQIHATIKLKIVNVKTAKVLATRTEKVKVPSLSFRRGINQAIERALKKMQPWLLSRIYSKSGF